MVRCTWEWARLRAAKVRKGQGDHNGPRRLHKWSGMIVFCRYLQLSDNTISNDYRGQDTPRRTAIISPAPAPAGMDGWRFISSCRFFSGKFARHVSLPCSCPCLVARNIGVDSYLFTDQWQPWGAEDRAGTAKEAGPLRITPTYCSFWPLRQAFSRARPRS